MVDYANIYHSLENINKVPEIVKEAYKFSMGNQILTIFSKKSPSSISGR